MRITKDTNDIRERRSRLDPLAVLVDLGEYSVAAQPATSEAITIIKSKRDAILISEGLGKSVRLLAYWVSTKPGTANLEVIKRGFELDFRSLEIRCNCQRCSGFIMNCRSLQLGTLLTLSNRHPRMRGKVAAHT